MTFDAERGDAINTIHLFLMRMCEPAPNVVTTRQELYSAYIAHVDAENERASKLDAEHEDDPDWLAGEPTIPLRANLFFAALPSAMSKAAPSAHATRVMINGKPSGQRGFKGVKLKEALSDEMHAKPSTPPDFCAASGGPHSFGPHGPGGSVQCEYCGLARGRVVGMRPELALPYRGVSPAAMLGAMERAFREGYEAGFAAGQDPDGTSLSTPAWDEFKSRRSMPRPGEAMDIYYARRPEWVTLAMLDPSAQVVSVSPTVSAALTDAEAGGSVDGAPTYERQPDTWLGPPHLRKDSDGSERALDWNEPTSPKDDPYDGY